MAEITEEGKKLHGLFLLNKLDAGRIGFPFLVDRDHHSSPGDRKGSSNPEINIHREYINNSNGV